MRAALVAFCLAGLAACSPQGQAATAPRTTPTAGQPTPASPPAGGWPFDFWVLALSWSPTYCEQEGAEARDRTQCAGPRPFSFVVHGLWPQYDRGYPRECPTRSAGPDRQTVDRMLDLMPSRRLVEIQWERHGTCSGLGAGSYFAEVRRLRQEVAIPPRFAAPGAWQAATAGEVEAAFIAANPGLTTRMMSVEARGGRLREVRICLKPDGTFRDCPQVDRSGEAPDTRMRVPPVRD